ncbi:MAG TPA: hypothetical protein ENI44_02050 [Thermoplasmatales archaeon]|nr:hypothetical protein [Thermoplasmatales archaeon]
MKKIYGVSISFLTTYICYLIMLIYLTYYAMFILVNGIWSSIATTILVTTSVGYPLIYFRSRKSEESAEEK